MIIGKQKMLFGASVLLLVLYLGYPHLEDAMQTFVVPEEVNCMNVPTISESRISTLVEGKRLVKMEEGVLFNYSKAPFDITNQTLYISQNVDSSIWEGEFDITQQLEKTGYEMFFLEDELFEDKEKAIRQGHEFSLYIIGDDYYKLKVIFSGVGVMSISELYELPQETVDYYEDPDVYFFESQPDYIGEATILAADAEGIYQTIQSYVKYHLKGATSANYPKKSYAITFVDEGRKDVDISLLGMSGNAKWKLNALYTDNTLVREKSAIDIWQAIDQSSENVNDGSFEARYIELIVDGEYVGVYLLVEPLDGYKLELDNIDVLYKCVNWDITEQAAIDEAIAKKWKLQFPFRIKHPKNIVDYAKAWEPIKDFNNAFFNTEFVVDKSLQERVNVENVIDVSIFLQVCALSDNHYKNLYYAARVNPNGTYEMTIHPWDFDLSFGHIYQSEAEGSYWFEGSVQVNYDLSVFGGLLYENAEIGTLLYDTYTEYREDILSNERIAEIMNNNWMSLQESGAYTRNLNLWKIEHGDSDADAVIQYAIKRLEYLDALYKKRYAEN